MKERKKKKKKKKNKKNRNKKMMKRHQMVSNTLALPLQMPFNSSNSIIMVAGQRPQ